MEPDEHGRQIMTITPSRMPMVVGIRTPDHLPESTSKFGAAMTLARIDDPLKCSKDAPQPDVRRAAPPAAARTSAEGPRPALAASR
ncbi:hypothetical protein ACIBHX_10355 [Nonomuraea sp. NPDC050536]|uniref:hypothetical protein n=1 Tax=Nonomuraea sp. NPDC050536 TaxID=3364366 RepID=UPI0037C5ED28